eukprot:4169840-Amphidinium_carterae.1
MLPRLKSHLTNVLVLLPLCHFECDLSGPPGRRDCGSKTCTFKMSVARAIGALREAHYLSHQNMKDPWHACWKRSSWLNVLNYKCSSGCRCCACTSALGHVLTHSARSRSILDAASAQSRCRMQLSVPRKKMLLDHDMCLPPHVPRGDNLLPASQTSCLATHCLTKVRH